MEAPFYVLSSDDGNTEIGTPNTSLSGSSHDTSRARYHISDVKDFAADLNEAAKSAFPNRGRPRYDSVNVCLIKWEDDVLDVQRELGRLDLKFQDYGFRTNVWQIPAEDSHIELMSKTISFIRASDNSRNLFVVYYAGHGRINGARQAEWTCGQSSVDWSAVQSLFAKAKSDVLILLDTCAAASSAMRSEYGVMEAIVACGFESRAPPPGEYSFTNTLIEVLDDWVDKPPFSASCLHTEILFQLKIKENRKGREGIKLEWCVTPIHINYTKDPKASSIELSRQNVLPAMPSSDVDPERQSTFVDAMDIDLDDAHLEPSTLLSVSKSGEFPVPHVLITVGLEQNQPLLDTESCLRWLRSIPLLAKWAKIEGVYPSYSTLVILSVPVPIWNMLPDHLACVFVGYATAPSLLSTIEPEFSPIKESKEYVPLEKGKTKQLKHPRKQRPYRLFEDSSPHRSLADNLLDSDDSGSDILWASPSHLPAVPTQLASFERHRHVIAIDYGTTFTGVAIATVVGDKANLYDIEVISDWGPSMHNDSKIPSVYSYSPSTSAGERQWGADLSADAVAMVNTKLELDDHDISMELDMISGALDGAHNLNFQYIKASGVQGPPTHVRKGPEDVVQDYLSQVIGYLLSPEGPLSSQGWYLENSSTPFDIVATIPTDWGYRAKNTIFRSLVQAGLASKRLPGLEAMLLVSEPEAAAVYTARYLKERGGIEFKRGECFILCDAGGATVDVIGYRVMQLEPTLGIERVTLQAGAKCGSVFIDMNFKRWFRDLIGVDKYQVLDQTPPTYKIYSHESEGKSMRQLMRSFDYQKRAFRDNGVPEIWFDLPEPYERLNVPGRIKDGEFAISESEMKSFFDPCVDQTIDLIQRQIVQIEMRHHRTKRVFLVGGFGESPYLQQELRKSLELRRIRLYMPDTSWTAVVRGAVISGIEKNSSLTGLPTMNACTRSYGVAVDTPFSNVEHDVLDRARDPVTSDYFAKQQMVWLIKKGDLILSDEPRTAQTFVTIHFTEAGSRTGTIPVYADDDESEDLPDRLANSEDELTLIHEIKYDLRAFPLEEFSRHSSTESTKSSIAKPLSSKKIGKSRTPHPSNSSTFYAAELHLIMRLDAFKLHIELQFNGQALETIDIPEATLSL